jgi:hypothetical protein
LGERRLRDAEVLVEREPRRPRMSGQHVLLLDRRIETELECGVLTRSFARTTDNSGSAKSGGRIGVFVLADHPRGGSPIRRSASATTSRRSAGWFFAEAWPYRLTDDGQAHPKHLLA